jgi:GH15 family glucan-1,4-alpha-glucosidase
MVMRTLEQRAKDYRESWMFWQNRCDELLQENANIVAVNRQLIKQLNNPSTDTGR